MKKLLKILAEFYPVHLLVLVFAPVIVGYVINYELVDSRYIVINLVWLSLFHVPAALLGRKFIYRLTAIIFFLFGFIEIAHWLILQGPLTTTSILVLSNTNAQEAVEFMSLKASVGLLMLIPYVFLFVYSLKHAPQYQTSKLKLYTGIVLLFLSVVFIAESVVHERFIRKSTPQTVKVVLTFIDEIKLYREVSGDIIPRKLKVTSSFNCKKQIFVLVIGESCNRNHMSLYGAERPTTPRLQKRNDILAFTNVVSPYSSTINSVLTILSRTNLENKISYKNSIDIFDVFSSAGFKTYWLSNQPQVGIWENMITVFAKKADDRRFFNTASNSSMEAMLSTSYDSKLFAPFAEALSDKADRKFIVLHIMGSHSAYEKRYPSEFGIFKGANKKERKIAEYDNSVYYNDFIIDSLLNTLMRYSASNKDNVVSAIYLSDHGENVYDAFDNVGHNYSGVLPNCNVDIPFIVWMSPLYAATNPQKVADMTVNLHKPYVSDDLFHSIIDLNGLQTKYFENKRSIFNAGFDSIRKRILEDGKDYDLVNPAKNRAVRK